MLIIIRAKVTATLKGVVETISRNQGIRWGLLLVLCVDNYSLIRAREPRAQMPQERGLSNLRRQEIENS